MSHPLLYFTLIILLSSTVYSNPIGENFHTHKRFTKSPPVFSPLERASHPPIRNEIHIFHPLTTSTIPPTSSDLPGDTSKLEKAISEYVDSLGDVSEERLEQLQFGLWGKIKHGLHKIGRRVEKDLKKAGEALLDGAVAAGVIGVVGR